MNRNDWPATCPHGKPSLLPTCALCLEKYTIIERSTDTLHEAMDAFNAWYRAGVDDSAEIFIVQPLTAQR